MTTTAEPAVQVSGLRKQYRDVTAVDGIDLQIRRGEIFALLGPNGAGKTTTVEILAGYRDRDGGQATVLGVDPASRGRAGRRWRARLGIVLQSPASLPDLTVADLLRHFARYYPSPRDPDQVLAGVGLTDKSASRLSQLSGGQRRRVDVALGILGQPELLFLDEPTTGFDPAARRQFWQLIRGLSGDGTTILLTTHYLDEARALADRVAVICGGAVVGAGTPDSLGGQQQAPATVTWLDDAGPRSVRTHQPTSFVAGLAGQYGGEIPGLTVSRPSLEDVYLTMIGASQ
jgi:ABC-2 type transport system ATP-binding protein